MIISSLNKKFLGFSLLLTLGLSGCNNEKEESLEDKEIVEVDAKKRKQ